MIIISVLEVNVYEMKKNLKFIKSKLLLGQKLCFVVKANCYGFGNKICKYFQDEVDYFAVSSAYEFFELQKITNIPIFDVITPTVQYVKDKYKSVALLATEATIENGTFQKALENEGVKVKTIACPSFVPYIEGLSKVEPDYSPLLNLREEGIDGIILGCTHYPYLREIIENISGLPTIDMGKCITKLIEVDNSNNKSVTVYVSKTTPGLEEIIESIIDFDVDIVDLDNKLKKTI